MIIPVEVSRVESIAFAIPKSITLAPAGESSTLAGLRSRCTSPAAWIALSASASSRASRCWAGGDSGQRNAQERKGARVQHRDDEPEHRGHQQVLAGAPGELTERLGDPRPVRGDRGDPVTHAAPAPWTHTRSNLARRG